LTRGRAILLAMDIEDPDQGALALAEAMSGARRIVALTGAGLSTECGVPDFRSPGSPWLVNKPIPFQAFVGSSEARREAWRRKFAMDDHYRGARPGRGHEALRRLHDIGRLVCVITQNIDNLHQDSGLPLEAIVELHGNGTYATCLGCGDRYELANMRRRFEATGEPPDCDACGGMVKSATISFGQAMPEQAMRRAFDAVGSADLFLALGSSLVVHPAARLPQLARARGTELIVVNRDPTPVDDEAGLVIRADLGTVLEKSVRKLVE
jgi:NAD-dependent deacetylase